MKLLVTGGLGFIGSNFINYWLSNYPNDYIVNVDKVTYSANFNNIIKHDSENYVFVKAEINDKKIMEEIISTVDTVINFAAESHVDNSIDSPEEFLKSNYMGVFNILELVRKYDKRFHQVSTDEVYGSLSFNSPDRFDETSCYNPKNPYSSTKAAADFLINAYVNTYGTKATISNCSKNFGPNQHPEKLIPKTILNALSNQRIPIYGSGKQVRDWIYVEDHCRALDLIIHNGRIGETYLVSAENEMNNIDVVNKIRGILNKRDNLIEHVSDRPGHDKRYALSPEKIQKELGWPPRDNFEDALRKTINHYQENISMYIRMKRV
ncbi:MAG: dTDP-glucose 4,6-dehydratase [Candidatus Thermoplasmatota archaeon]|nr:dTDP-glucose 4,6-dehydratase [Candidatus Thermoplasmatota archaeon]